MYCLVIVPFLNEGAHLPAFLESMDRQTRRPDRVVLVDDGSDDDSPSLTEAFAASRPWVTALRRPRRAPSKDRLRGAPELEAFLWGLEETGGGYDVLVKMDADLRLSRVHFETVLGAFERDPSLGMAGTYLAVEVAPGDVRIEAQPAYHVRGPTRFYRRACYEDVSPIPVMLGWDGADELRARARGWRTQSLMLPGEPTLHLRPTGLHDGRVRAHVRWGECAYAVGAHPLAIAAGAAIRMRNPPRVIGGLAYAAGWATAPWHHVDRVPEDIRSAKRAEQRRQMRSALRKIRTRVRLRRRAAAG